MTKEIKLTSGLVAVVDDSDWPVVNSYTWQLQKAPTTFYAITYVVGNIPRSMHRMIVKARSGQLVDHRDGNGLNNTRNNLRVATRKQNGANRRLGTNNQSGYKGVYWLRKRGKWVAQINVDSKSYYLGVFDDPWEAAQTYNLAASEVWGEYALLNTKGGLLRPEIERKDREIVDTIDRGLPEMTTSEVARFVGASSSRSANTWLRRCGIVAISRQPGPKGENIYLREDIEQAKNNMPGQGKGGGGAKHHKNRKKAN